MKIVDAFDPDIMIIQECEEPDKLHNMINDGYNVLWIGDNKSMGLSIISKDYLKIKKLSIDDGKIKYMVLIQVNNTFKIAAFWAMNDNKDFMKRYIGQVWIGLNNYLDQLDKKTMVIGDFNWNVIWDRSDKPLYGNLSDLVELLKEYQIESSYHYLSDKNFGEETNKTFFMHKKADRAYHTDYMFIPTEFLGNINKFSIGKYEEWIEYSDHMPLMIDF